MAGLPDDIYEQYPPAEWSVAGQTIVFHTLSIDEEGRNRIVRRARPYRDGWKTDDIGSEGKVWTVTALFNNSINEPGVDDSEPHYPDRLNRLLASFDEHEVGTLTLPTRGPVRCRAESYRRSEKTEERDQAIITLTWVEDNGDDIDASAFQNPTVRASVRKSANDTKFDAEKAGGWDGDLDDLTQFASQLEDALAAPGEFISDVESKATSVGRSLKSLADKMGETAGDGRDLLSDPANSALVRRMELFVDRLSEVADEKMSSSPRIVTRTFPTRRDIFSIAAELGQDEAKLVAMNFRLPNLLNIPAGTAVRVFES